MLAEFQKIDKEFPNKIVDLAIKDAEFVRGLQKQQAEHVQSYQKQQQINEHEKAKMYFNIFKRGQYFAFVIVILALIFGFILVLANRTLSGFATIISAAGALIGTLLWQSKTKRPFALDAETAISK